MRFSIFDNQGRTDRSPARHSESIYTFLCRVAGPEWDQRRELIDSWIDSYPAAGRPAISARLQIGDDRVFTSTFWELYLHETYRRDGWEIDVEPEVPNATTRPDFLVSKGGTAYYLEARCTFEGGSDQGAAARLHTIYDAINEIDSSAFYLAVAPLRIGSLAPSIKKLQANLEAWLARLDPDAGASTLGDDHPEHRYEWIQGDWQLVFHFSLQSTSAVASTTKSTLSNLFMGPLDGDSIGTISTQIPRRFSLIAGIGDGQDIQYTRTSLASSWPQASIMDGSRITYPISGPTQTQLDRSLHCPSGALPSSLLMWFVTSSHQRHPANTSICRQDGLSGSGFRDPELPHVFQATSAFIIPSSYTLIEHVDVTRKAHDAALPSLC